ncbi:MAG: hypothetical protein IPO57_08835 [Rhodocyclales bacterium]|nr:hypothetical protein [Rhodocyclales bacterium]
MSWEAIAGLSSAVIALCALGLTVWQAKITRYHNRLSVTPHLTTWSQRDVANNRYSVELLNNGIGPALVESFYIHVDGQLISGEGMEPIEKALKILFPQYQYASWQSFVAKGYMMAEKEARNLVTIVFQGEKVPTPAEVEHATKRARLLITYKSIYGDEFTLDSTAFRANPAPLS